MDGIRHALEGRTSRARCCLASIFLHAVLLVLVFSRGAPAAEGRSVQRIIEVSLIESLVGGGLDDRQKGGERERRELVHSAERGERAKKVPPAISITAVATRDEGAQNDDPVAERRLEAHADAMSGTEEGTKAEVAGLGVAGNGSDSTIGEGLPGQGAGVGGSSRGIDPTLLLMMRKIEAAKRYPRVARMMGIEGTAVVRFRLEPSGQVEAVEILESSGSEILDRASLETVRDAAPLPFKEGWLKVGIVFRIL